MSLFVTTFDVIIFENEPSEIYPRNIPVGAGGDWGGRGLGNTKRGQLQSANFILAKCMRNEYQHRQFRLYRVGLGSVLKV